MINSAGRKRVIITNILPAVENGRFAAKAIINQELIISADIFTDGHDEIAATILIKHTSERQWKELELKHAENDRWELIFEPTMLGIYQFQVQGWIDHFATWKKDLIKKYEANQDISVELKIGRQLVENALTRASGKNKTTLEKWISDLDKTEDDLSGITAALDTGIDFIMHKCRDKNIVTVYPQVYQLEVARKKAMFSSWYEMFPRSAAAEPGTHGTFKDVQRLLPRIAHMGFDVLYMPPVHPIGESKRKGKNNSLTATADDPGSPWAIGNATGGHKALHPQLGTLADFKDLVKACKKHGIEVAMDLAFQCAPDHPYVKKFPQWFKWRPDGTVQYAENPPKKYEDIIPFNFETDDWENLWNELKSVIDFWVGKGVEIFRVDNPHTKAIPFWEWAIAEVRKRNPNVLFLAEAFTRPRIMERLAKAGFDQSYTYFSWRTTKRDLEEYLTELTHTDRKYYFRPNFWPNTPDILPAELVHGGENAHIMRLLLAATMSSNYGIYGPVYEFGINEPMPGKEEYIDNEKYEIKHWDWGRYTKTTEIIIRINRIRKQNVALQTTENIHFGETSNEQLICYLRADKENTSIIIIVVNLDPYNTQKGHVKIPMYKLGLNTLSSYKVYDLLSGDKYYWTTDWNYVELNPYDIPAHILRVEL